MQNLIILAFLIPIWIAFRQGSRNALFATGIVDALVIVSGLWLALTPSQWTQTLLLAAVLSMATLLLGFTISQNRDREKILRAERDRLRPIIDATSVGILVYSEDGDGIIANQAAANIVGAPDVEAMMKNFYQIRAWRDHGILDMVKEVLATGISQRRQFHIHTSFGKEVWIDCQAAPLAAGAPGPLLVVLDDISERMRAEQELALHRERLEEVVQERTADLQAANMQLQQVVAERVQIEQALRESEEHFRLLAENSQDTIFRLDLLPKGRLTYISPAIYKLTGYTSEEHFANPYLWRELISAEDRQRYLQLFQDPTRFPEAIEAQWRRKDGTSLWHEERYMPILNDQGQYVTIIGIARDITERRQADEQLRKLSSAVGQSSVSITITDAEGHIEYVNPFFTQVTGYSFEEVRGELPVLLGDIVYSSDPSLFWQKLQSGQEWRGERRYQTKFGSPYWESGVISPIYDNSGKISHFVTVMKDVTERKQREREHEAILAVSLALRAANDTEEMLAVITQEITATFDAVKTFFITHNPSSGEMVVEAVYEEAAFAPVHGVRIPPGVGVAAKVYESGLPYVSDNAFDDPLFATPELLGEAGAVTCVPLIAQEKTIGLFSVARRTPMSASDVRLLVAIADMAATGLQRAAYHEETLRHAALLEREVAEQTRELREANMRLQELDKLKSKFVSDVSHELRTPVTNMGLYLKLFHRKPEKQDQYLTILQEEADRLETLVLDILDLAQLDNKPTVSYAPVHLNDLLQGVVMAHKAKADERNLELRLCADETLPVILGDAHKLVQVATNLVANAINYTPSGYVHLHTFVRAPHTISFAVEDSGIGIYPEDLPHIYERFYRGRRDQIADIPGTGLGLSIVKELIELHAGSIQIESDIGRGTTFTVTLPKTIQTGR